MKVIIMNRKELYRMQLLLLTDNINGLWVQAKKLTKRVENVFFINVIKEGQSCQLG